MTLDRQGSPGAVGFSSAVGKELDAVQYAEGGGPCLSSLSSGSAVLVEDAASAERWPGYQVTAKSHEIVCSFSLPLTAVAVPLGTANLYSRNRDAFTESLREGLEVFAEHAAWSVADLVLVVEQEVTIGQLEHLVDSRAVIGQAIGILMQQERCSSDEALKMLKGHSQNTNRKLRQVADHIIARATGQPPQPPPAFVRSRTESVPDETAATGDPFSVQSDDSVGSGSPGTSTTRTCAYCEGSCRCCSLVQWPPRRSWS